MHVFIRNIAMFWDARISEQPLQGVGRSSVQRMASSLYSTSLSTAAPSSEDSFDGQHRRKFFASITQNNVSRNRLIRLKEIEKSSGFGRLEYRTDSLTDQRCATPQRVYYKGIARLHALTAAGRMMTAQSAAHIC